MLCLPGGQNVAHSLLRALMLRGQLANDWPVTCRWSTVRRSVTHAASLYQARQRVKPVFAHRAHRQQPNYGQQAPWDDTVQGIGLGLTSAGRLNSIQEAASEELPTTRRLEAVATATWSSELAPSVVPRKPGH